MKSLKNLAYCGMALALLASCESDVDEIKMPGKDDASRVQPVMNDFKSSIIVDANNADDEKVIFSWSPASFGVNMEINYTLYFKNSAGKSVKYSETTDTYMSITKGDINGIVLNELDGVANQPTAITAYVSASPSFGLADTLYSSNATSAFKVTTFEAPLKCIYCAGGFQNWKPESAPILWETKGGSNKFTAMIDFTPASDDQIGKSGESEFKLLGSRGWTQEYHAGNHPAAWTMPGGTDGTNYGIVYTTNPISEITLNMTTKTCDRTIIGTKLYLVGSFCNWGNDGAEPTPFVYQSGYEYNGECSGAFVIESVDLAANAEIKVYVDKKWDINWGATGKKSSAVSGGLELGNGASNIQVAETGTYKVVFHANRTPYVLELLKQ